jgi:uncharacterized lipoprotein YajG
LRNIAQPQALAFGLDHPVIFKEISMNTRILLTTALVALLTSAPGCSLKPQNLRIAPEVVKAVQAPIGGGKSVGLRVSDSRADKKLGEVGDPDRKMVDVRMDADPSPVIYERLKQAMIGLGFSVEPYNDTMDRTLDIKIVNLQLKSIKKPLTFETVLRAQVGARAVNSNAHYDRQFNVKTRKDGVAPSYEKESTMLVNTAMTQVLEDLLADEELFALLAR